MNETIVVHTVASLDPRHGGVARAVPEFCDALAGQGVRTAIVSVASKSPSAKVLPTVTPVFEVPAVHIGERAVHVPGFRANIRNALQDARCPVIHDHGIWGLSNILAAREAARGSFLVISPHGMLQPWALEYRGSKKRFALRIYQHRILSQAALFFATAESELEAIRIAGYRQPVAVVPLGVAIPKSGHPPHENDKATYNALFLSRIHPKKGLLTLVESWRRVRMEGWTLTLAGPDEGGHRAQVEVAVAEAGLAERVKFVGELEGAQKAAAYEAADLFVLPTQSENFGVVVLEAMAHRVPVLTTTGAPWKEIEEFGAGWWVEPTVEGLQEGLSAVLSASLEGRRAMGERGRRLVEERYGWSAVAEKAASVYSWLCGHSARAPSCVATA